MKKTLLILAFLAFSFTQAQIVNIPDVNFKNALLSASSSNQIAKDSNGNYIAVDTNNDGKIQNSEAESIYYLSVADKDINDLTGVEAFTYLTYLSCYYNQLTSLDVTQNTNLEQFWCNDNQLTNLDVTQNTNLTYLSCYYNQLTSLDVIQNTNLTGLSCQYNQLTNLDVSNNTNLTLLYCHENQLSDLDVSQNTNLTYLDCGYNQLTSLDVTQNTNLTGFNCAKNQLTSLDVTQNTDLAYLYCYHNQLTSLDVTQNTDLAYLDCSNNQLTSLDVTQNTNLTDLNCYRNQLSALDVSQNTNLEMLGCGNNQLTSLNVSQNTNLERLGCDFNQLTSLDVSQNTNLTFLNCYENQLSDLDVSQNTNLTELNCSNNQLTGLNVSQNTNLTYLSCFNNQLTNLDVTQNTALTYLNCSSDQLTSLDISQNTNLTDLFCDNNQLTSLYVIQNTNLEQFWCNDNQLTSLDVSQNTNLRYLYCGDNPDLSYINLKNGNNQNVVIDYSNFQNLPNLQTVCVDELNTNLTAFINTEVGHPVTFNTDCSIVSTAGNNIDGTTSIDLDLNGCDANDITLANMLIMANNGTESFGTMTQTDGSYSVFTNEGDFNTSLTTNLPDYFTATPSSISNTFTGFDNTFTADFCVAPNQTVNDVNISLIPISQARAGFNTTYQIVYKNVGTTVLDGDVTINFEDSKLTFLNASETPNSQTSNSLTFNYTNLNPFETRTINLEFNVIAPPTVNVGDVLNFTTSINPIAGDYTTDDNTFMLNQTVISSYDPNDITCLEGNQVLFTEADKYLHYIIRFQNKGTADAINVVVKNTLDDKLDWTTLQLETASHQNRVAIKNGNQIEFIFENIHLPDDTTDEAGSHGYIAYKIKPKSTVVLNDIIHNQANIFFDYNEAVPTNTTSTQFVNTLAIKEANLLAFTVYPTPTSNLLSILSKTTIVKIEIYTKLGQLVLSKTNQSSIDATNLSQGLYFCKVTDEFGNSSIQKMIKE